MTDLSAHSVLEVINNPPAQKVILIIGEEGKEMLYGDLEAEAQIGSSEEFRVLIRKLLKLRLLKERTVSKVDDDRILRYLMVSARGFEIARGLRAREGNAPIPHDLSPMVMEAFRLASL